MPGSIENGSRQLQLDRDALNNKWDAIDLDFQLIIMYELGSDREATTYYFCVCVGS